MTHNNNRNKLFNEIYIYRNEERQIKLKIWDIVVKEKL